VNRIHLAPSCCVGIIGMDSLPASFGKVVPPQPNQLAKLEKNKRSDAITSNDKHTQGKPSGEVDIGPSGKNRPNPEPISDDGEDDGEDEEEDNLPITHEIIMKEHNKVRIALVDSLSPSDVKSVFRRLWQLCLLTLQVHVLFQEDMIMIVNFGTLVGWIVVSSRSDPGKGSEVT
jgi:hypothetical protein